MAFKDILLVLTSYPEPTPLSVVEEAVSVASTLGAHIAALSCEMHVQVPGHFISGAVVGLPEIVASEAGKSLRNAQDLLAAFDAAAAKAGVSCKSMLEKCRTVEAAELLVEYARLRDLTIMPEQNDRWYAEAVMFGSGRPTLVLPQNTSIPAGLRTWDRRGGLGFQPCRRARGVGCDAATGKAKRVRVSPFSTRSASIENIRRGNMKNLTRHRIDVVLDRVDAKGRPIGAVLEAYVASHGVDLLVMGAYGHSAGNTSLGGATDSLLSKPPLPILFSH